MRAEDDDDEAGDSGAEVRGTDMTPEEIAKIVDDIETNRSGRAYGQIQIEKLLWRAIAEAREACATIVKEWQERGLEADDRGVHFGDCAYPVPSPEKIVAAILAREKPNG